MRGQAGQIGVVAGQDHLLHGRFLARQFHETRRRIETAPDFVQQFVGRHAKGHRQTGATANDIADEFVTLRANAAREHGPGVFLEERGQLDEIERAVMRFKLARLVEGVHEGAQPETVEVVGDRRRRFAIISGHARAPIGLFRRRARFRGRSRR